VLGAREIAEVDDYVALFAFVATAKYSLKNCGL